MVSQGLLDMPIAVIGMSCRFPSAETPSEFWTLLSQGKSAWSKIPKSRFNAAAFQNADVDSSGTFNCEGAHFLRSNPRMFDAQFFEINPTEASVLDPQQRLQLECAYEVIENAGISMSDISGTDTAVYVSVFNKDYDRMLFRDPDTLPAYHMIGNGEALLSNRISHFFNLSGPSITLDTGCSGGLVALHQACQSLRTGESRQALVGGANLILAPEVMISLSGIRFFSPEGRCFSYDHRASGYGRGEGVAAILIKPLSDALADGDPIRAVIRSTAVNQDGWTPGITLPNAMAQVSLIRDAYNKASLDPLQTKYCEAHGTGTAAGDPIEAYAIYEALGNGRSASNPLYVGSVKTNIGHLESASGLAGVIKTILILERGTILPNFDFQIPNKDIKLTSWNLVVPTSCLAWPDNCIRQASVNSFGYGGTNCHAVLQAFDSSNCVNRNRTASSPSSSVSLVERANEANEVNGHSRKHATLPLIFVFSSKTEKSCLRYVSTILGYVNCSEGQATNLLTDLAYTLSARRSHFAWRMAVVSRDLSELKEKLSRPVGVRKISGRVETVFIFTGQGAQWYAMGRELLQQESVFAASLARVTEHLQVIGAEWDLHGELLRSSSTSRVMQADPGQLLVTAIQLALTDLLASRGIRPSKVIGHSSGEIAAAYACGALTFESAISVAFHRGRCIANLRSKNSDLCGAMMAVHTSEAKLVPTLDEVPTRLGRAVVACENSPGSVTISGDKPALEHLRLELKKQQIPTRMLGIDTAYHSHHMSFVADEYLTAMTGLQQNADELPISFYSSVKGSQLSRAHLGASYWVQNMVSKVCFAEALKSLCSSFTASSHRPQIVVMLEVGPHHALAGPIQQILKSQPTTSVKFEYMHTLKRNEDAGVSVAELYCKLWSLGVSSTDDLIAIRAPVSSPNLVLTDLPPYPWEHSTEYWHEPRISREYRNRPFARHPLLGQRSYNYDVTEPRWWNVIQSADLSWLNDHVIQSSATFPAAAYFSMVMEALRQHLHDLIGPEKFIFKFTFRDVSLERMLIADENSADQMEVVTSLQPDISMPDNLMAKSYSFCIRSLVRQDEWTQHCRGLVRVLLSQKANMLHQEASILPDIDNSPSELLCEKEVYAEFERRDVRYSGVFRSIVSGSRAGNGFKAFVKIQAKDENSGHVSLLDKEMSLLEACLQSAVLASFSLAPENDKQASVLTHIGRIDIVAMDQLEIDLGVQVFARCDLSHRLERRAILLADYDSGNGTRVTFVSADGITATTLSGASRGTDQDTVRAYSEQEVLDVTRINPRDIPTLCRARMDPSIRDEVQVFLKYEAASLHFATQALQTLDISFQPPASMPHLKHFHKWLVSFVNDKSSQCLAHQIQRPDQVSSLLSLVEAQSDTGKMLCRMGRYIPKIIDGSQQPLPIMLQDDLLAKFYHNESLVRCYLQMKQYIELLARQHPLMKVLEIGAGTGGTTVSVLNALSHPERQESFNFQSYDFTDISSGFFEKAKHLLRRWSSKLAFRRLDIELSPEDQGFGRGTYDLVVASNVLHATTSIEKTVRHVRQLLKPGGVLVLLEITTPQSHLNISFGGLPGWWAGAEEGRTDSPLLSAASWESILSRNSFSSLKAQLPDYDGVATTTEVLISIAIEPERPNANLLRWCVFLDAALSNISGLNSAALNLLKDHDAQGFDSLAGLHGLDGRASVVFTSGAQKTIKCLADSETVRDILSSYDYLLLVIAESTTLKHGAHQYDMIAKLRQRMSAVRFLTLKLSELSNLEEQSSAVRSLTEEHYAGLGVADVDFHERAGRVHVLRYLRADLGDPDAMSQNLGTQKFFGEERLLIDSVHRLSQEASFAIAEFTNLLSSDELQVRVSMISLAYDDSVHIHSPYNKSKSPLREFVGTVTHVGNSCAETFHVGDVVSGITTNWIGNSIRTNAVYATRVRDIRTCDAIYLPMIFVTALYSVQNIAKAESGEHVLIYDPLSLLSQAIIRLTKLKKLQTLAVVNGSQEKELLQVTCGIPGSNIFEFGSTSIYREVMSSTQGRGVDIVMGPSSDEEVEQAAQLVATFGRIICWETYKPSNSIRMNSIFFERHISWSNFSMAALYQSKRHKLQKCLAEATSLAKTNLLQDFRGSVFPVTNIVGASRQVLEMGLGSKVFLEAEDNSQVKCLRSPRRLYQSFKHQNVTVLLLCDSSGLEDSICKWLLSKHAKNIVFLYDGMIEPTNYVQSIAGRSLSRTKLDLISCNISDNKEVTSLARKLCISGIICCQIALNVATRGQARVVSDAFADSSLDFFLVISTIRAPDEDISLKTTQDTSSGCLEHPDEYLHRQDCNVFKIELGLLPYPCVAGTTILRALSTFDPTTILDYAIKQSSIGDEPQCIFIDLNDSDTSPDLNASFKRPKLLHTYHRAEKNSPQQRSNKIVLESTLANLTDRKVAKEILYEALVEKISGLLAITKDDISPEMSVVQLGVDSLVAAELRSWISITIKANLEVSSILEKSSLDKLAENLLDNSKYFNNTASAQKIEDPSPLSVHAAKKVTHTLAFQKSLPKLPVPKLRDTLEKYIESIKHFLDESSFAVSLEHVRQFQSPDGVGQILQQRLILRSQDPDVKNWLYDYWVDNYYLKPRKAISPTTNFFMSHSETMMSFSIAKRAAVLSKAVLTFMNAWEDGTLEPHMLHGSPIDMESYHWLFNSCRVPRKGQDESMKHPSFRRIVVIYRENFWKIEITTSNYVVAVLALEQAYEHIIASTEHVGVGIGVMTAEDRDTWAELREHVRESDPINQDSLDTIESSAFVVCLDNNTPTTSESKARQFWHGNGRNRWSDKPLQFIVTPGCTGFCGEHSRLDGSPVIRLNRYVNDFILNFKSSAEEKPDTESRALRPQLLAFKLDNRILESIDRAQILFDAAVARCKLRMANCHGFGEDFLRSMGFNPSACVQMAFQLASYRYFGRAVPSFEPVANFRFQQGRYDAVRTVTDESTTFCRSMLDETYSQQQRFKYLRRAIAKHVEQVQAISFGGSGDNHMFALYMSLKDDEPIPAIFTDPIFRYSTDWFLSTSYMPADDMEYGFGPDLDDGWSIQYPILPDRLLLSVTTRDGRMDEMYELLLSSIDAVRMLLLENQAS